MPIGKPIKQGFLKRGVKGKFLSGTIKHYGNKKGIAQKVIRRKWKWTADVIRMGRIKIRLPRPRKGFVSVKSIMELNPNLQVVKVRKRFKLKKLR